MIDASVHAGSIHLPATPAGTGLTSFFQLGRKLLGIENFEPSRVNVLSKMSSYSRLGGIPFGVRLIKVERFGAQRRQDAPPSSRLPFEGWDSQRAVIARPPVVGLCLWLLTVLPKKLFSPDAAQLPMCRGDACDPTEGLKSAPSL